jgi:hypothetical protein
MSLVNEGCATVLKPVSIGRVGTKRHQNHRVIAAKTEKFIPVGGWCLPFDTFRCTGGCCRSRRVFVLGPSPVQQTLVFGTEATANR